MLNSCRIFHRSEVTTPIYMLGEVVGTGRADIVVGQLAVEIKALAQLPPRVFGQLAKYVDSLNKDVMDTFHGRCIQSSFFAAQREGGGDLSDSNYQAQLVQARQELYSGVIINFNQRTAEVEVLAAQPPSDPAAAVLEDLAGSAEKVKVETCEGLVRGATSGRAQAWGSPCPPVLLNERGGALAHSQECAVLGFLRELSNRSVVFEVGASSLYAGFLASKHASMCVMSNTAFGRLLGVHVAKLDSGVVKRRTSANGGHKYVFHPRQVRKYLSTCEVGAAASEDPNVELVWDGQERSPADEALANDVENFVRCCLEMRNGKAPLGLCLNDLVREFELFTCKKIENIRGFRRELRAHLREIQLLYYPKDQNQCVFVSI